jgi:hypothetical protein
LEHLAHKHLDPVHQQVLLLDILLLEIQLMAIFGLIEFIGELLTRLFELDHIKALVETVLVLLFHFK